MSFVLSYIRGFREGTKASKHIDSCPSCQAKYIAWAKLCEEIIEHSKEIRK